MDDRINIKFTLDELGILRSVLLNAVDVADWEFPSLIGATVDEVRVLAGRLRDADPSWGITPPQT